MTFDDGAVEGGTSSWDHVKLEAEKLGATLVALHSRVDREVERGGPRADRSRCLIVSVVSTFRRLEVLNQLDSEHFKFLCSSSSPPNTSTPDVSVPWIHIFKFFLLSLFEV